MNRCPDCSISKCAILNPSACGMRQLLDYREALSITLPELDIAKARLIAEAEGLMTGKIQ